MANTLTAQFAPSASMRITDPVVYAQIAAQYGFGVNIIFGVSPQTLAAAYGINWVNNPTAADYNNLPCVFTTDAESKVLGTTILSSVDGVQTLAGQDYTDPNGQHFTSVTWEWQVEVQFYNVLTDNSVFSQQVVTWIGDATMARLIPTTIDLSKGITAIWIFSSANAPVFVTSEMIAAGKFATYCITPASITDGVVGLTAAGFQVTGATAAISTNRTGIEYTAVVWNDTLGTKMQVGSYTGGYSGTPPHTSTQVVTTGLRSLITMGMLTGGNQSANPDGLYFESDHGGGNVAFNVAGNEVLPITGLMVTIGADFEVGMEAFVNDFGHVYYYVVFAFDAGDPIRTTMMNTYSAAGTDAALDVATSFAPGFVLARTFESSFSARWRGPTETGTISRLTDFGTSSANNGITAFAANKFTLGTTISKLGITTYGFYVKGGSPTPVSSFPPPTWVSGHPVDLGDGTIATIQDSQVSQTSPGDDWTSVGPNPTYQWWCQLTFGLSVYQIDSPGSGWVACSGPASDNGWYLSTAGFANQSTIVSDGRPANPRSWAKLSTWCTTGHMNVYGGSPGAACSINNRMVYAASDYVVGTDFPPIRLFDGRSDKELCRLPSTVAGVTPKAVMSMLTANGTVYLSTWDSGTSSADWTGRVFQLDPETGILTVLGVVFAAGELPYALAWHMGRLWCGTNNAIGTVGKVYFFRPGIDTAWTTDHSAATESAGGITSLASYKGKLYVGTDNAAAARGKVLVRDTAGAYTTSQTGTGGTAVVNNGYLALTVLGANLYASYWNKDSTEISKIEKFDGSSWTLAYTGVDGTLRPFIVLQVDNNEMYALGGGMPYTAALLVTSDGTTWTDLTAELPETDKTLLPMFGEMVT